MTITNRILSLGILTLLTISCVNSSNNPIASCDESEIETSQEATKVSITPGLIAGYINNGVYTYKGIPYAKAERFMPAEDPEPWDGIKSCRAYGPTCPQSERTGWSDDKQAFAYNWNDGYPGEDCLRVNVWTTGINDGKKRPVMVWLHGGGFHSGSGQEHAGYDGTNMAKNHDVVMVTLNHRLNVLGFLDLSAFGSKYQYSGNVGMLDIVKALEWVRDNISTFGGDPNNVTIFGQSGGGGKVTTLMAMPSARGLFHKAIVESGSIGTVMSQDYSRRLGVATIEELGIKPSNLESIKDVPYKDLLAACQKATQKIAEEAKANGSMPQNFLTSILFGTEPTVDGVILPTQPSDASAFALSSDIPLIIGTTYNEFTPGQEDQIFRPLAIEQANQRAKIAKANTYLYLFKWESPVFDGEFGSMHCMEIPFVFDNVAVHNTLTGGKPEDVELGHKISSFWASFARNGVPVSYDMPEWEPYSLEKQQTIVFDRMSYLFKK